MDELIRITENDGKKAVSARELHEFLESKQEFVNWIKNRIEKYDLVENVDFVRLTNLSSENQGRGGQNKVDYALSVDAAKELSMVEGNEKGKRARRYFIACEKIAKSEPHVLPKLQDLTEAQIIAAKFTMQSLNMNDASKIPLLKAINEPLGLPTPDYVESKGVLVTISDIAREVGLTAAKANQILASLGILEKKTRKSTKDKSKEKCFWAIAPEYSYLGENLVNPSNQSETQPKWYVEKKGELLELLKKKNAA